MLNPEQRAMIGTTYFKRKSNEYITIEDVKGHNWFYVKVLGTSLVETITLGELVNDYELVIPEESKHEGVFYNPEVF